MKITTFNVNGLRAINNKNFNEDFKNIDADIFCIQETKLQQNQFIFDIEGYKSYLSSALKKGYSGTLVYTKIEPLNVFYGIDGKYNDEGRIITVEYDKFFLVNAYVPNSGEGLKRLDYRMQFEEDMKEYLISLDKLKPIIYCGDLNVAHEEIDIKNPKANRLNAGFTNSEREKLTILLNSGFTDAFRYKYKDKIEYTWWSYKFNARKNNAGWRIDYFIVSDRIKDKINDIKILKDVMGSDHCPVLLDINQ